MNSQRVAEFNKRIAGEVVVPTSPSYEELRSVFNQNQNIKPAASTQARKIDLHDADD